MSESQKRNFYGDTCRPALCEAFGTLRMLTGSDDCANELIEAAEYVERVCGPEAMVMPMGGWIH